MSINPPSSRPPFNLRIAIGSPIIVLLLGLLQLISALTQPEQGPVAYIVPGACLLIAAAMAVTVVVTHLRWKRHTRLAAE